MNIFIRELKANRKALIIWSVCMVLFVMSGMSKYTAYSAGGASSDVFEKIPLVMREILGMGSFDVTKMIGFYAFLFTYIVVTTAVHAVLLGNNIIAKEERDKTTEFLIVKPVSRYTVITAKLLAAVVNVIIINIVTLLSSLAIIPAVSNGETITGEVLTLMSAMLLVQLIFLFLGALLAAIIRKPKASGSIGVGILLAAYIVSKVTDVTDKMNALNIFSPFKYFSLTEIVNGAGLDLFIVILTILLSAVFAVSTYYFYLKRDLNI
jgi:ABC-2 type transport system permease protein